MRACRTLLALTAVVAAAGACVHAAVPESLPEPTTTYWLGASLSRARSLTGITRTPPSTSNGGGVSSGMSGAR